MVLMERIEDILRCTASDGSFMTYHIIIYHNML